MLRSQRNLIFDPMNEQHGRGLKRIQLDDKTIIWVLPHVDEQKLREKYSNRKPQHNYEYFKNASTY